jgi:hypothetical protein
MSPTTTTVEACLFASVYYACHKPRRRDQWVEALS